MGNEIKFGTDGWRAVIARDFTFENVRRCAQGVADYLKTAGQAHQGLVIGYDTRFASENFAAACAEVLAANGIKVYLCTQATPTPIISFGVTVKQAAGAIIITASHNPPMWNGFKYKTQDGASAPTEVISQIEENIARTSHVTCLSLAQAGKQGLVEPSDLSPIYFEHIAKLVDLEALRRADFRVVVDSMYGAGLGYFRRLLEGSTMSLVEIHGERNPFFPGMKQPEPIAENLKHLTAKVKRTKASVGIATDGDADRVGIMDEKGNFLTQLQVFALLCLYLLEVRGQRGAIVKTVTTTSMVYRLGELFKVPVYETAVGFKYVAPVMLSQDALIGGEESGGYGFHGHIPERDGILAGLYFLDFMLQTGQTPSQLLEYLYRKVGYHYYHRLDITFPGEQRTDIIRGLQENPPASIEGMEVTRADTTDGFRYFLADNSWLLLRFSGTEPLLRIYAETDSPERVQRMLAAGKKLAGV